MRRALLVVLAAVTLAGCGFAGLFGPSGGPYPAACDSLGFAARQCDAIVARAEKEAAISPDGIGSIDILPPTSDGSVSLGGQMIARVRFHSTSGAAHTQEVWCTGIHGDDDLVCNVDATIGVVGGIDHDVPCTGEAPDGCATPPPTARPASIAAAKPLHVATLDIPIDHLGPYQIEVGTAGLPDGVLSVRSAAVADPKPKTFWIAGGIILDVRPVDPKRPPVGNVYREPFDGVEPVKVFLVFEVSELTPGGVLQVRDVVVR